MTPSSAMYSGNADAWYDVVQTTPIYIAYAEMLKKEEKKIEYIQKKERVRYEQDEEDKNKDDCGLSQLSNKLELEDNGDDTTQNSIKVHDTQLEQARLDIAADVYFSILNPYHHHAKSPQDLFCDIEEYWGAEHKKAHTHSFYLYQLLQRHLAGEDMKKVAHAYKTYGKRPPPTLNIIKKNLINK